MSFSFSHLRAVITRAADQAGQSLVETALVFSVLIGIGEAASAMQNPVQRFPFLSTDFRTSLRVS